MIPRHIEAIAIGASAGGIDALPVLLPALPASLAAAVFIVLHLPRERPSLLTEIFRGQCALPVREAEDKDAALPGTIYFAPPDYHLLIETGPRIALSIDAPVHHSRPSIDVLFESAADVYAQRLMGIILTGANEDGSDGFEAIRRAGGMTIAQDPAEALATRMILSALSRGPADLVLPLERIAALLRSLGTPDGGATLRMPQGA